MNDQPDNPDDMLVTLSQAERIALKEMLADRLWGDEALKKGRRFGILIAAGAATLAFLAVWWPWITSIAQAILKDVPRA